MTNGITIKGLIVGIKPNKANTKINVRCAIAHDTFVTVSVIPKDSEELTKIADDSNIHKLIVTTGKLMCYKRNDNSEGTWYVFPNGPITIIEEGDKNDNQ